ncbi:MAG: hypothetical protein GC150_17345 [Rhizobiales bacterium]|nr:hypothetical protein [Hyphomicrobiales bacterium]
MTAALASNLEFAWIRSAVTGLTPRSLIATAILVVAASLLPNAAAAQFGQGENRNWQFLSPSDRSVRAGALDLLRRHQGGYYNFAPPVSNYDIDARTFVAGDYYSCEVSASASANTGFATASGAAGAPTVLNNPSVGSTASGNTSSTDAATPLNGGTSTVGTTQTNSGSAQNASVAGSTSGGVNGTVGGSSTSISQVPSNSQSALNSPQTASVTGSTACSTRTTTVNR